MRKHVLASALVALSLAVYGGACSTTTTPDGDHDGGADTGTTDTAGDQDGGAADAMPDTGGPDRGTSDGGCGSLGGQACVDCCRQQHQHGADTFDNALANCACGDTGVCDAVCAQTFCSGKNPDATCASCLQNAFEPDGGQGPCYADVAAACSHDPDCVALYGQQGCVMACP